jgi:hypothetical protein
VSPWSRPLILLALVVGLLVVWDEVIAVRAIVRWRSCGVEPIGAAITDAILFGSPPPGCRAQ